MQKALEKLGIRPVGKVSLDVLLGESFNGNLYGMSQQQMERVRALREIIVQYNGTRCRGAETVNDSMQAALLVHASMKDLGHEEVRVALLNSVNVVLSVETVFRGTTSAVNICPKDILSKALSFNAEGIILYHNHPSSDVRPGMSDVSQTSRLKDACSALGIRLVDHIIIGKRSYYSFSDGKMTVMRH